MNIKFTETDAEEMRVSLQSVLILPAKRVYIRQTGQRAPLNSITASYSKCYTNTCDVLGT